MGSSNTALNDDSATISDDSATRSDSETETDEECRSSLASRRFEVGEKVLAFHKDLIYEAKVVKIEYRFKERRYFLHYPGWKKSWDEWVEADRLLKFNEENVQKQQALARNKEMEKNTKAGQVLQTKQKTASVARGKKRKNNSFSKEKGDVQSEKFVNLQIPPTLKKQLIDDCEFITHLGKLVKLPRTPSVDDILKKYSDYRLKKDGLIAETVVEILKGLQSYFDKALPVMLLYKSERQQFDNAIRHNDSPSTVYGAEHLLRLFVKLPELLAKANIEEETLAELQEKLVDFLKFLQKNQSVFFLSTYHVLEETETSTNKQHD